MAARKFNNQKNKVVYCSGQINEQKLQDKIYSRSYVAVKLSSLKNYKTGTLVSQKIRGLMAASLEVSNNKNQTLYGRAWSQQQQNYGVCNSKCPSFVIASATASATATVAATVAATVTDPVVLR